MVQVIWRSHIAQEENTIQITNIYNHYYFLGISKSYIIVEKRSLSCYDVIRLIEDPAGIGYRFVAMLGSNKFAIYNCESLIEDKDTTISSQLVDYLHQEQSHTHSLTISVMA